MLTMDQLAISQPVTCPDRGWRAGVVGKMLDQLVSNAHCPIERRTLGLSFEGRPVELVRLGTGPKKVLAWSQMHGDEQTYTTVVLNLLRLLVQQSASPLAARVLQGCSLSFIPMLNPDGAERLTRCNAQGIDINRDARCLSTPEGRMLHEAVTQLRPHFAFNLHNQNHRRRLPNGEGPVALSLLVPPPDAPNTPSASTAAAARVAADVCRTTRPHCGGRVTRYGADYMPRAFGEWVQSQGVSTVLLEAGGWPNGDVPQLEQLNLLALAAGLESIATGSQESSDPADYLLLPRAAEHEAFDLRIRQASVVQGIAGHGTVMDLGVNRPEVNAMPRRASQAEIVDLGDLAPHGGLQTINAAGLLCLPGRIAQCAGVYGPDSPPPADLFETAVRHGVTTLVLAVDLKAPGVSAWIDSIAGKKHPLLNVVFLGEAVRGNRGASAPIPGPAEQADGVDAPSHCRMPPTAVGWIRTK